MPLQACPHCGGRVENGHVGCPHCYGSLGRNPDDVTSTGYGYGFAVRWSSPFGPNVEPPLPGSAGVERRRPQQGMTTLE